MYTRFQQRLLFLLILLLLLFVLFLIFFELLLFRAYFVCVDVNGRGKGIGGKMMDFASEYAKKNNISRLELTSSSKRVAAHKLYLSCGYVKRDSDIFRKDIL